MNEVSLKPTKDLPVIAAYWVGPYLSWIEQLGLLSFVKHGHKVILYTHGEVVNVPDGVEVRPAQEIYYGGIKTVWTDDWPPSSLAVNADIFKWHLQRQTDYIYTDADIFCLQPISIFSQENFLRRGAMFYYTHFFRMVKGSQATELICQLLDEEYPIFPWWPAKVQKRRQKDKRENRGWPITAMGRGAAGDHIIWPSLGQTGEMIFDARRFLHMIPDTDVKSFFSLPAEDFERCFLSKQHHAMTLSMSQLYRQRGKLLKDVSEGSRLHRLADDLAMVPEHSWLGQLAAEFDIDPAAAPLVKTRRRNHYHVRASLQRPISVDQDMALPVIAAYWVGPYLSWIEQMGLLSFVKHGHKVVLYTHGEVKDVPDGVEVRPAQEIYDGGIKTVRADGWPPSSLAINADIFKWYLQRQTDYIYADANTFCLQPVSVFSRAELHAGAMFAGAHFFRMPKDSRTTQCICDILDQEYPIFPWHSRIKRMRRRFYKFIGRGKPIAALASDIDEDKLIKDENKLIKRALSHTGEGVPDASRFCVEILRDKAQDLRDKAQDLRDKAQDLRDKKQYLRDKKQYLRDKKQYLRDKKQYLRAKTQDLLFMPAEEFEGRFLSDMQKTMMVFSATDLYWQFGEGFKNVPQHSWLGRVAAELGVDPAKAPLVKTRLKNNEFAQAFLKRR